MKHSYFMIVKIISLFLYSFMFTLQPCFADSETEVNRLLSYFIEDLPPDLLYQGKPIDALCIQEMIASSAEQSVQISHCMKSIKNQKIRRSVDRKRLEEKFIGYDTDQESNYYQWLGTPGEHQHLLYTEYSGGSASGGVGIFSELVIMERHDDHLKKIAVIAGGDREARGIHHFSYENGKLKWSQYLTPDDVVKLALTLSNSQQHDMEYEDLEYCPLCGVAVANFETVDFKNRRFLSLQFTADDLDSVDFQKIDQEQHKNIQECFDVVRMQYIEEGKTKLNPEQLRKFFEEVMSVFRNQ